jgi:hypothetical protein
MSLHKIYKPDQTTQKEKALQLHLHMKKNLFKELSYYSANTGMPKTGRDYYSS